MNLLRERQRLTGAHRLRCSEAPDVSGINRAAEASAEVAKSALDWYTNEYAKTAPIRDEATQLALTQARLQNEASQKQMAAADESLGYQRQVFRPIEQKLAADALAYDTPARREAEAAAAGADVSRALDAQRQATMRAQQRSGVAPNSGAALALQGVMDIGAARAIAGAENVARRQVEAQGVARLGDVANLGRGIASNQVAQLQSGSQVGSAATGAATAANGINTSGAGMMQAGFGSALQGYGISGGLYGQQANIQQQSDAANAALWGALGTAGGMALGRFK